MVNMKRYIPIFLIVVLLLSSCSTLYENVDQEWCDKLIDKDTLQEEWERCYLAVALKERDPTLCEKIATQNGDGSKDACYSYMSEIMLDPALCEKIQTIQTYEGQGTRDTCYHNLAPKLNDIKLCDKIQQQDHDLVYKDPCLMNVAVENSNPQICSLIKLKSSEYVNIASQDNCFGTLAIHLGDSSLCDKAGFFQEQCNERVQ